jgi:hypothetical protein
MLPYLCTNNAKVMSSEEPTKRKQHNEILSELLVIALTLKIEYVDHQHETITAKEYQLIERLKELIEEFEELDVSG